MIKALSCFSCVWKWFLELATPSSFQELRWGSQAWSSLGPSFYSAVTPSFLQCPWTLLLIVMMSWCQESKILEGPCKEVTLLPNGPAKGQKDGERTEASVWGGKAERAVTAQSGEEKAQEDPINVYKYLNRMSKRTGSVFFSVVPSDRTRGNGNGQEVSSGHQETLLHGEGYWALAQVLREVVQSSSLETLKSGMDTVLDNQLQVAMKRGIGRMTSRGPFQPQQFCDIIILPSRSWWTQLHQS